MSHGRRIFGIVKLL